MSEPDTIKQGWSVGRLWCLWCLLVAGSFVASIVLALVPLALKTQPNYGAPPNGGPAAPAG